MLADLPIAELGHVCLIMALLFSAALAVFPLWGSFNQDTRLVASAQPLTAGLFVFTALAYAALTYAFLTDDFTLVYVASNSNSMLPWFYKMTAVWGGHEGSFLLWVLTFAAWTQAVALFNASIPRVMLARVLSILGMVSIGFYLFMLLTSNPFDSLLPFYPIDGRDLNPLLQDIGMIIHPPMLYMGYVGFSVAFAFAIAALMSGQLDSTWARWSRPWTIAAWGFLTVGIALGSWWAYYELGWGGWWFWDPVENASFMPWLVGTALMHSLAVTEKRKAFKSWTVLLAISAFSLSLLGTFLVRSGILVSVHSFASDPSRGLFILGLLVVVIGGSLLLYFLRASHLKSVTQYNLVSRETMLLANNLLLCAATLVVLIGTLLPLVHKELGLGSISVGAPFFNQMFTLLMVPFILFIAVGPLSRWRRQRLSELKNQLLYGGSIALIAGILLNYNYSTASFMGALGLIMAFIILASLYFEMKQRTDFMPDNRLQALKKLPRSHWGMFFGHLGFAITIVGITLVSNYEQETSVRVAPGAVIELSGYEFTFLGVANVDGPNYESEMGHFEVREDGQLIADLYPEKRFYPVQQNTMTEAGIHTNLWRDLFVALGEPFDNGDWSIRLYVKPFVVWIWLGSFIMALGGGLSIADKRYRVNKRNVAKPVQPATASTTV